MVSCVFFLKRLLAASCFVKVSFLYALALVRRSMNSLCTMPLNDDGLGLVTGGRRA